MHPTIRPIAIGIFRRDDRILVGHGHDVLKGERFCRPPGGAIEFGERAADALRREIREEIRAEITNPHFRGVLENTFTIEGVPQHELIFVFETTFLDAQSYQLPELPLYEPGWDGPLTWELLESFRSGQMRLYPEGLWDLLNSAATQRTV
jgi:8-oxo-dGTP pyrophosphatase MutT (NUDIX family)